MRPAPLGALLTVAEAARMLGETPDEVRARIEAGSLRTVKELGTGLRVPADALREAAA